MAYQSSRLLLASCITALLMGVAVTFALPISAQQAQSDPPIDYALFNQPDPLWLPGADLRGAELFGVDLAGANLREANFDDASLARADLSTALLVLATLRNANLKQANLQNATLGLADLRAANLAGADLSGAQMQSVLLAGAKMDGARVAGADLRQSDMKRASLRAADLSHVQLSGADMRGADLSAIDLSGADLSSVNLDGADLSGAKLDDVSFDSVTVWPENFDISTMRVNGPSRTDMASQAPGPHNLAIAMTLNPENTPWFNQVARPQDTSLIDRPQQIPLLDAISTGSKMVVFKSVDNAQHLVPEIADKFDIIGYNLEHGPLTPLHEQADPIGSVQRMRALADAHGLKLAVGPDHDFALSHGEAMAPYADIYAMQVQRVQSQPDVVREFVVPMAAAVRAANPAIETSLQVRTEGDPEQIAALVSSLRQSIDGVAILSSPETVETAKALVDLLHEDGSNQAQAQASSPEGQPQAQPESVEPEPQATSGQQSSVWPVILGIALQLLVVGLIALFVLAADRVTASGRQPTV